MHLIVNYHLSTSYISENHGNPVMPINQYTGGTSGGNWSEDTLGDDINSGVLPFVEKLSSSWRFNWT